MLNLKEKIFSKKHWAFDLIIGLLIIIVIILIDVLVVKFKSAPGEFQGLFLKEEEPGLLENENMPIQKISAGEKVFIPILNFHHLGQAPLNLSKVAKSFYVEPEKFEVILNDLIINNYRPVFVSEIAKYLAADELPQEKIIAITFDDGNEDFYSQAWPILQKLKIKSNLYVMTGVRGKNWVTPEQIVELDKSGLVEIGSHTVWHPYLTRISEIEQSKELKDSKEFLDKLLNKNIETICYPFGLFNQQVEELAQEVGYKAGLTFDQDAWQKSDELMELKRISVYPGLEVIKFLDKLKNEK